MTPSILNRENQPSLAYYYSAPRDENADAPFVMFCGGYKSDMGGTKATYLERLCQKRGLGYVRFDYRGHGASDGAFIDGTISAWCADAMDIYNAVSNGRRAIVVGSSMGGWIALLMALAMGDTLQGIVGIAAAPDFTVGLWEHKMNDAQRTEMLNTGRLEVPNDYSDEPYIFTKNLVDDGRDNLLLDRTHDVRVPITLLQGKQDADVAWETALHIEKSFAQADVKTIFIDDGDHRLSRDQDLEILQAEILAML